MKSGAGGSRKEGAPLHSCNLTHASWPENMTLPVSVPFEDMMDGLGPFFELF